MTSPLTAALERLAQGLDLTSAATHAAVSEIIRGASSEAQTAAFLTALRLKGEVADELSGAVEAIREHMAVWVPLEPAFSVLDTCGTGGDGLRTVNVSTATAIVAAACGVPVAKHGNRSASGNSGSAEVLAELGVAIEAEPAILHRCLRELGITFLFAPQFHPALRFAAPVRRQLPFRTLFNLVGPLANPARPDFQLLGTASESQAALLASALSQLGVRRAAVVTGSDGLDEVTLSGPTQVIWVEPDRTATETWQPSDFGLPVVSVQELRVAGPAESAARLREVFQGASGPVRDVILANTAAALLVAGRVATLPEGVARAALAIDSNGAAQLLERWGRLSRS